jgi:hypothetical protein
VPSGTLASISSLFAFIRRSRAVDSDYAARARELGDPPMPFSARRLAATVTLIAVLVSLATSAVAVAASGTITEADCVQGTIKDRSSGQPISRPRCESLIGRNVQLANTGFDLRPVIAAGALCLVGAAAFGMRRRSAQRVG